MSMLYLFSEETIETLKFFFFKSKLKNQQPFANVS